MYSCKFVIGSKSMHVVCSISHTNNLLIDSCDYSCTCSFCKQCGVGVFLDKDHHGSWKLFTLEPCTLEDYVDDVETYYEYWSDDGESNCLASMLNIGGNFAVQAIAKGVDTNGFRILKCTS